MTTSLTVQPDASLMALMLPSAVERIANRRCGVIVLLNGVGGAGDSGILTRCVGSGVSTAPPRAIDFSRSRAWPAIADTLSTPAASAKLRTIRNDSRIPFTGLSARLRIVRSRSSRSLGTSSPTQSVCSGKGASGDGSVRMPSSSTPDAPSMVEWWVLVSIAHRPSARPSMTYASHSGRERSMGRPTMRDTCSAS